MTDKKIGKYTILGKLGKGGMGIVYKAVDPIIGRTVAIKTIRLDITNDPEEQEEATRRFIREAQSAGNLNHPNIVTIYDVGEDDGLMFIAMEYIEGTSLEEFISGRQSLAFDTIVNWIHQIGEALDYAHSRGVIHRDIKPGNILIDARGVPHIVDFGIARIATSTLTMTGTSLGTPSYMAPEQIAGEKVDFRADIFSLGAILYELLTFKKAFSGDSFTSVIYKIMNEEPPPVQNFNDRLPYQLDEVVRKALAKNVKIRYQSCRELAEELRDPPQSLSVPPSVYEDVPEFEPVEPKDIQPQVFDLVQEKGTRKKSVLIALLTSLMMLILGITAVLYFVVFKPESTASVGNMNSTLPPPQTTDPKVEPEAKSEQPYGENPAENPPSDESEKIDITRLLDLGTRAFNSGDFDVCTRQMEDVLKIDPNNAEAKKYLINSNLELGLLALKEKNYDQCILFMNEVLRIEPGHVTAQQYTKDAQKGKAELLLGNRIQEVLTAAQRAQNSQNFLEVIRQAEVILSLDPSHPAAKNLFLSAHQKMGLDEFNKGNYEKCVDHMQSILRIDPKNSFAQNYFETAANKIQAQKIDTHLKQAQAYYQQMKYKESIQEAANVLKIDPKNKIAAEYINLAKFQMAPQILNEMVKLYAESVQNKTLEEFYRQVCDTSLYERIKNDTNTLFTLYTNFQIAVSNTSVKFEDSSHAEVSFSHVMTGVAQASGQRTVLSEGTVKWTMKNISVDVNKDDWKILDISYSRSSLALSTLIVGTSK